MAKKGKTRRHTTSGVPGLDGAQGKKQDWRVRD